MAYQEFSELELLENIIAQLGDYAKVEILGRVACQQHEFPLYCITLGSDSPDAPVLAYFSGVHGLEKIGSEIIFGYLQTIIELLKWDQEFQARLEKSRLIFFPLVNPVGVFRGTRCNGNGVDLMRNSPVKAHGKRRFFSGQRLSPHLPWYQGNPTQMETESLALCEIVRRCTSQAPLTITVDLHSGFGIDDRLWFPYACCKEPYPDIAQAFAWKQLLERCYPNHFYKIEPMSQEYVIDGDLWDYLYQEFSIEPRQLGKPGYDTNTGLPGAGFEAMVSLRQNWLLIRGLARESGHWGDFLTQLQRAFPQAQIHCLDLPGCGINHRQSSPDSISK